MAEPQKLGPNVTFVDYAGDGQKSVTVDGVLLEEGKATNLVDALGEARAGPLLKKLSGNPSFKVDGGPDHQAEAKKKDEFEKKQAERQREIQEEEAKAKAEEEKKKADEVTKKANEQAAKSGGGKDTSSPGAPGQHSGQPTFEDTSSTKGKK
jgi:hypothetical protein